MKTNPLYQCVCVTHNLTCAQLTVNGAQESPKQRVSSEFRVIDRLPDLYVFALWTLTHSASWQVSHSVAPYRRDHTNRNKHRKHCKHRRDHRNHRWASLVASVSVCVTSPVMCGWSVWRRNIQMSVRTQTPLNENARALSPQTKSRPIRPIVAPIGPPMASTWPYLDATT